MTVLDELPTFKASDGREIALLPGWFQNKVNIGWPGGIKDFKTFVEQCVGVDAPDPRDVKFFTNKIITANAMKCLFEENGVRLDGSARLLDVCTGPAVQPRTFKALGWCREAHGVDISNRQDEFSDAQFLKIWREARNASNGADFDYGLPIFHTYESVNSKQTGINNCFDAFFLFNGNEDSVSIDSYSVCDFLDYEPPCMFDLVTLNRGMENFDSELFFAKLSSVMEPGGVYATFNDYFYDGKTAFVALAAWFGHAPAHGGALAARAAEQAGFVSLLRGIPSRHQRRRQKGGLLPDHPFYGSGLHPHGRKAWPGNRLLQTGNSNPHR